MNNWREPLALNEKLATALMWLAAGLIAAVLSWIVVDILLRGISQLSVSFLVKSPEQAGLAGGIGSILISTVLVLSVTLVASVPLSFATAVALSSRTRRQARLAGWVRTGLDVLSGVPSIVFGLFGNALFCVALGMGYSILSGGLTLACMILPILIRTTEQALRSVPDEYRQGAAALGLSRTTFLVRIEVPTAAPAMAAGLVLGIGRAVAETAALLFTAGYVTRMPTSVMDSGRVLSVHIYDLAMNVPGGNGRACATAAVLIAVLLVINALVVAFSKYAFRQGRSQDRGGATR